MMKWHGDEKYMKDGAGVSGERGTGVVHESSEMNKAAYLQTFLEMAW